MNFGRIGETLIVMLSVPFALVGGVLLMALLGYHWSVATAIGFVALAGVAAETGVIMLIYLNQAWEARTKGQRTVEGLRGEAIVEGAVDEGAAEDDDGHRHFVAGLMPLFGDIAPAVAPCGASPPRWSGEWSPRPS